MSRRAIAAITIGAGALLVVLGSLFPLYGVDTVVVYGTDGPPGGVRRMYALTPWELVEEPAPPVNVNDASVYPTYGYSLVAAAVLAGLGAGLQLRSSLQAAIGRFGVLAGFGLLVGTLWTALETLRLLFGSAPASISNTKEFVGAGTWVLGVAAVVMLVGGVLAQDWPPRAPRPGGVSVYQVDDDDTPPFGIAIPVSELDVPAADPVADPVVDPVSPAPPAEPGPADDDRRHPTGGNPSTVEH
ncbi:hypothetical protein [Saccharothrix deserti]|uniref:hypothetical protein n=1 Tax=Saccharothrix deserti TaxID=2593674 RepID=UPI00131BDFDD|nr:hypothetical protein [Saccharothrix deserti]